MSTNESQFPSGLRRGAAKLSDLLKRFHQHARGSWWLDLVFPLFPQPSSEQIKRDVSSAAQEMADAKERIRHSGEESLADATTRLEQLVDAEDERKRGVETRLSSIIGLASIAATIATGVIVAQASGSLKTPPGVGRWLLALSAFYLVLQLCIAIFSAVRGQARGPYMREQVGDVLPRIHNSKEETLRLRIASLVEQLQFNRKQVNGKVSLMAVAHRAAMNFAVGLLVLSIIGIGLLLSPRADAPIAEALQLDANIRELLRGPRGPAGPVGPKGESADESLARREIEVKKITAISNAHYSALRRYVGAQFARDAHRECAYTKAEMAWLLTPAGQRQAGPLEAIQREKLRTNVTDCVRRLAAENDGLRDLSLTDQQAMNKAIDALGTVLAPIQARAIAAYEMAPAQTKKDPPQRRNIAAGAAADLREQIASDYTNQVADAIRVKLSVWAHQGRASGPT